MMKIIRKASAIATDAGHTITLDLNMPAGRQVTVAKDGEYLRVPLTRSMMHFETLLDSAIVALAARFDAGERGDAASDAITAAFVAAHPRIPLNAGGIDALIAADRPS